MEVIVARVSNIGNIGNIGNISTFNIGKYMYICDEKIPNSVKVLKKWTFKRNDIGQYPIKDLLEINCKNRRDLDIILYKEKFKPIYTSFLGSSIIEVSDSEEESDRLKWYKKDWKIYDNDYIRIYPVYMHYFPIN